VHATVSRLKTCQLGLFGTTIALYNPEGDCLDSR
jgi:hypothetical protein